MDSDDDDTDTQGVGLVARRGTRFVSDSLKFTGTDLGDRQTGTLRRNADYDSDEEDDSSESDDEDDYDLALLSPEEKEEALVQTAMARIQRAQEKGRTDVSLTKDELAALERRKQRLAEEAAKAEKRERRKRREQRIAIPLTQLEPVSRKKKPSRAEIEAPPSRHPSATDLGEVPERQVYPPMGYFPPPSGTRSRPRSGTSVSSRPPSRLEDRQGSPFQYEYVQRPSSSTGRHVSDSVARPRSSRSQAHEEYYRNGMDPFQFQTAGPRAPHPGGAAAAAASSRRYGSTPNDPLYMTRREGTGSPAAARGSRGSRRPASESDDTSEEEESEPSDQSTSDDFNSGAKIRDPVRSTRSTRSSQIIVEPEPPPPPEPEPEPPAKKKSSSDIPKRKPVPSRGGRRKKK